MQPEPANTVARPQRNPARDQAGGPAHPVILQFFSVQGPGYRCVAYCDPQGVWREAGTQQELFGEIRILE